MGKNALHTQPIKSGEAFLESDRWRISERVAISGLANPIVFIRDMHKGRRWCFEAQNPMLELLPISCVGVTVSTLCRSSLLFAPIDAPKFISPLVPAVNSSGCDQ